MEAPALKILHANGLDLAAWDWPGAEPALVFAHATGFHGRCWDRIARLFPGRRRVALDFRGHGRSAKPTPPVPWAGFGRDLRAVVDTLALAGPIGIGHSMGGHSVVAAAPLFSALLLIDPTIFPPERYGEACPDVSFIRRRRTRWSSPAEMFERFCSRLPFSSWQPDILRDYCEFGLLPDGGDFVLACPPEFEASIYEHARDPASNLHHLIPAIAQPVTVLRAGVAGVSGVFNLSASPTAPDLASRFPHATDVPLEGSDHYIPMVSPDLVAEEITRLISRRTGPPAGPARP